VYTKKIKANKTIFQQIKAGNFRPEIQKRHRFVMRLVYRITNEVLRDLIRSEHEGNIINSRFSLV